MSLTTVNLRTEKVFVLPHGAEMANSASNDDDDDDNNTDY
jgi:hypothetical protein